MDIRIRTTGEVITESAFRALYPYTGFPAELTQAIVTDFDGDIVVASPIPSYDPITEFYAEVAPTDVDGVWVQTWEVLPLSQEQIAANIAREQARIYTQIVEATQKRLDDFAATRNYSGILSACTYATSPTLKFATEGQYCVAQRDATWSTLYAILAEVQAGTRTPPTGYADIESELPVLTWPT